MEKAAKTYIFFPIFYLEKIRSMLSLQTALNALSATSKISIYLTDVPAIALLGIARFDALGMSNEGKPNASDNWSERSVCAPFSQIRIRCSEKHKASDFAVACR